MLTNHRESGFRDEAMADEFKRGVEALGARGAAVSYSDLERRFAVTFLFPKDVWETMKIAGVDSCGSAS